MTRHTSYRGCGVTCNRSSLILLGLHISETFSTPIHHIVSSSPIGPSLPPIMPWPPSTPSALRPNNPRRPSSSSSSKPAQSYSNPTYPLRVLADILNYEHYNRGGRYTSTLKAKLTRDLFHCIWYKPEWRACFLSDTSDLAPAGGELRVPPMTDTNAAAVGWVRLDENELDQSWRLSDHQAAVDAKRKAAGKQPIRAVTRGMSCGKVLQRFDRTYLCK